MHVSHIKKITYSSIKSCKSEVNLSIKSFGIVSAFSLMTLELKIHYAISIKALTCSVPKDTHSQTSLIVDTS